MPTVITSPVEICLVTPSIEKSIARLGSLGIGPFKRYVFDKHTLANTFFRGKPAEFALKVAFAQQGAMTWEIMEPVAGPTVMGEFLERNGKREGVQHVAFDFAGDWLAGSQLTGDDLREATAAADEERAHTQARTEAEREAAREAARRRREFDRRGWGCVMRGTWRGAKGTCEFMYFEKRVPVEDTGGSGSGSSNSNDSADEWETEGTCTETIVWSADWEDPEEASF